MIYEGSEQVTSLMIGEMGIKKIAVGTDVIYERTGSFFYIQLINSDEQRKDEANNG